MKITLEQDSMRKDVEVTITFPLMNKTVERIVSFVKSIETQIECYAEDSTKLISVYNIFYIESVDKTTIVYTEKKNYRCKLRLYQLHETLRDKGFVQISKYCILNLNKLDAIKPLLNSRMEAVLSNDVRLFVNRKYLADIKKYLQENPS
jgi:DNA-binding LytR/AlgR family response regulator